MVSLKNRQFEKDKRENPPPEHSPEEVTLWRHGGDEPPPAFENIFP
jgi:hypothetical protein